MGGRGGSGSRNNSQSLGLNEVRQILSSSMDYYEYHPEFVEALAKAELEYTDEDEVKFRFAGKDKNTGRTVLMDVSGRNKADVLSDIRHNGYTVQRLYTVQVYKALIKYTDGEKWELSDATKIDNALLKKNRR